MCRFIIKVERWQFSDSLYIANKLLLLTYELRNIHHNGMIEQYIWISIFERKNHSLATDIRKYQHNNWMDTEMPYIDDAAWSIDIYTWYITKKNKI